MVAPVHLTSPTHGLVLRSPVLSDAAATVECGNNPANTVHLPHLQKPSTVEHDEKMIGIWQRKTAEDPPSGVFLVAISPEGKLIGTGGVEEIFTRTEDNQADAGIGELGKRVGTAGIMINPEERGKGYAVEAMRMSFEFGFKSVPDGLGLDEIVVATSLENGGMRGVMEKKFGLIGVERQTCGDIMYTILVSEWRGGLEKKMQKAL